MAERTATQDAASSMSPNGVPPAEDFARFERDLAKVLTEPDIGEWMLTPAIRLLSVVRHDPQYWGLSKATYRKWGGNAYDLEKAVDDYRATHKLDAAPATSTPQLPPPETLTELLAADIAPPRQLFEGLMHDGMLLFGGKSKRGKSWLMFDLAIALAVGRAGFRHFACPAPMPVLYLALEDGRARLQGRARAIQPNLTEADTLHLRYTFPPLTDGGIEALQTEIALHHYGLVVIDVLAKLERAPAGKSERGYHDIYDMFTPLQELRKHHPFCLAMLTHLRKQEAEDVFDALMGSVAYQGAQDVLWVLERKPKDDFAFLHIRDKDAEDQTIALRFTVGHWEYIGEGEEYEVSRDSRRIIHVLTEEKREMSIAEIMKGAGFDDRKYAYVRNVLVTLVKDDFIHRTKQGRYSATVRGAHEFVQQETADYDDSSLGF
jgi:AAA domain